MENPFSKEEKEEKAVQGRVRSQVGHREGKIVIVMELHGHEEVFGREKDATMSEIVIEKEKKVQELVARRET
jgi:hypothetical protein